MAVVQKTYDLTLWALGHTQRFPRSHRHSLGTRIEAALYELLERLIDAQYEPGRRRAAIDDGNRLLTRLRFLLRLATDLRVLALRSHGHAAERIYEIGRMLGGWRRTVSARGS